MKSIRILLVIVLSLFNPLISCINQGDPWGECPDTHPYFAIQGIKSYNYQSTTIGPRAVDQATETPWDSFFIRYEMEVDYIAQRIDRNGSLMALSCVEGGYKGDKIGIDTLYVKTVNDYSDNYSAGAVVNDIVVMNIITNSTNDFDSFFSLEDYISNNEEGVLYYFFEIKLTEGPSQSGAQIFELEYVLNDGQTFTDISTSVILSN
ncbi:hypothetical protein [Reichenbachiella ulvae]|uniref:DUF5034 domain-containing protein n=1 Tax=Reichenbachiella ulvae TaxID=2980104 RepID=A0ABT3CU95_9BACT|nr:hypothetical protein [Reichenbachiella ulvae]MCV9387266.1 hypothetical protein [Reichenbachiella ulvae]